MGTGFAVHAHSLSSELSRPGAVYDPSKVAANNRANAIAIGGFVAGGTLIAAGVAMYWWGHRQDRPAEKLSLAPMVSGQVAGLALCGTLP